MPPNPSQQLMVQQYEECETLINDGIKLAEEGLRANLNYFSVPPIDKWRSTDGQVARTGSVNAAAIPQAGASGKTLNVIAKVLKEYAAQKQPLIVLPQLHLVNYRRPGVDQFRATDSVSLPILDFVDLLIYRRNDKDCLLIKLASEASTKEDIERDSEKLNNFVQALNTIADQTRRKLPKIYNILYLGKRERSELHSSHQSEVTQLIIPAYANNFKKLSEFIKFCDSKLQQEAQEGDQKNAGDIIYMLLKLRQPALFGLHPNVFIGIQWLPVEIRIHLIPVGPYKLPGDDSGHVIEIFNDVEEVHHVSFAIDR